jgi:uncharacterized protein YndB with AHSA1/START domain
MATSHQQSLRAETVVALPPIEVWQAFTRPVHLFYWLGEPVEVDLRVGGAYIVRGTHGIRLDTTVERVVEGRRLVLRPTRRGDDARIEIDLVKLSGAETRVCVADPDSEDETPWRLALENLRSVWERGIDLRESRGAPPPSRDSLIRTIRESAVEGAAKLEAAVRGLLDADAYRAEGPDAWSVAQVLAHLSITERMLQCWLDQAARGERPAIHSDPCTDVSRIAGVLEGRPTIRQLLDRIRRDEAETVAFLSHIPASVAAFKPRWGRVAFTALDYHAHTKDHLGQIARIRTAIGT